MKSIRTRFWVEAGIALTCGLLAAISSLQPDWIEVLTGVDPDQHQGSTEWLAVITLFLVGVFASFVARSEWRRATL